MRTLRQLSWGWCRNLLLLSSRLCFWIYSLKVLKVWYCEIFMNQANGLRQFSDIGSRFSSVNSEGRDSCIRCEYWVVQYLAVIFDLNSMSNYAILTNVYITSNLSGTYYCTSIDIDIVSNRKRNILQFTLALSVSWP